MKALYQRGLLARVGPVAVIASVLAAAACSTAEPTAPASAKERPVALVATPPRPTVGHGDVKLSELIENAPKSVVAGERLNVALLKRFYARHGFAPVWTTRQGQANSLIDAVSRAGEHGLSPDLFHANLLQTPTLPAVDRELLLSDAFLSYADALARGYMPRRAPQRDDHRFDPDPVDAAVVLDTAIGSRRSRRS